MNYLLLGKSGNAKSLDWLRYFDVVVVGCGKPAYFQGRGQLFSVDVQTGSSVKTVRLGLGSTNALINAWSRHAS